MYTVQSDVLPSIELAVIRRQVTAADLSRVVPECCGLVWQALKAQHATGGRHVAIYWNGDIRIDAGAEVTGPFVEQGDVIRSATPSGLTAFTTHYGGYGTLGAAHKAIREWCAANGHRLAGPNWEIYGHLEESWNANPSRIRTDVFYKLA